MKTRGHLLYCIVLLGAVVSLAVPSVVFAQRSDWTAQELAVPFPPAATETELIEELRSGSNANKAIACKQLSIYGSKAAVPELAKLLGNEELSSWARIALEAIPDAAADEALVEAAKELDGLLLVGVINSIGVRRTADAVDTLVGRLKDEDDDVACAAAVALGRIGGDTAVHSLHEAFADASPELRSAIAEGGILCAEHCLAEGDNDGAAAIYDAIRHADVPKQRILEGIRGAILARGEEGIPLLIEQLKSSDKAQFQIALMAARELSGTKVAEALAAQLAGARPERAALIVTAIGDRTDASLPRAVLEAARNGDTQVRLAAIEVIGKLGDKQSVATLVEIASDGDSQVSDAAKSALASLPGDDVDAEIVRVVSDADGKSLAVLFATIGQRRIDATDHLVKAVEHQDTSIRHAALKALGATVGQDDFSILISRATKESRDADGEVAWKALEEASIRMPDRETAAGKLAAAMSGTSTETKARLLKILGAVSGKKALETVARAAKSDDEQLQDAGTRVLGEWMTADAAQPLYEIASSDHEYKTRALRGYLRIARQLNLPDNERLAMCRKALEIAERPQERELALDAMKRAPSAEAIELASSLMDDRRLRDRAVETAIFIGEAIKATDPAAAKTAGEKALEAKPPRELAERARALTSQ